MKFVEHDDGGTLIVAVNSVVEQPGGEVRAARIETRAIMTLPAGVQLEALFTKANAVANRAFFKLLNRDELRRFGVQESLK